MLLLNKDKQTSIADYLQELNIVPVAISYEFDPCDKDKAIELAAKDAHGEYQKSENEDLDSITRGLIGKKGQIHIEFCQPILADYQDSKEIANAIDAKIIANYKLYDSNLSAYAHLSDDSKTQELNKQFLPRLEHLTEAQQHWLLTMYANPVSAKKALNSTL